MCLSVGLPGFICAIQPFSRTKLAGSLSSDSSEADKVGIYRLEMMGPEWASNGCGVCQTAPVSGFLLRSAVCLFECLLFWMHSIEDTNYIIHGRQAGNGKDE